MRPVHKLPRSRLHNCRTNTRKKEGDSDVLLYVYILYTYPNLLSLQSECSGLSRASLYFSHVCYMIRTDTIPKFCYLNGFSDVLLLLDLSLPK